MYISMKYIQCSSFLQWCLKGTRYISLCWCWCATESWSPRAYPISTGKTLVRFAWSLKCISRVKGFLPHLPQVAYPEFSGLSEGGIGSLKSSEKALGKGWDASGALRWKRVIGIRSSVIAPNWEQPEWSPQWNATQQSEGMDDCHTQWYGWISNMLDEGSHTTYSQKCKLIYGDRNQTGGYGGCLGDAGRWKVTRRHGETWGLPDVSDILNLAVAFWVCTCQSFVHLKYVQ